MTTHTFNAEALPSPISLRGHGWASPVALLGSGLVAVGTVLPWFSFFAGLHPVRGVDGMNGRLLLATGIILMLASGVALVRSKPGLQRGIGWAGLLLSGVLAVLMSRIFEAHEQLSANPMMVARLGPGLFVSVAGAVLVAATLLLPARRRDQTM